MMAWKKNKRTLEKISEIKRTKMKIKLEFFYRKAD